MSFEAEIKSFDSSSDRTSSAFDKHPMSRPLFLLLRAARFRRKMKKDNFIVPEKFLKLAEKHYDWKREK